MRTSGVMSPITRAEFIVLAITTFMACCSMIGIDIYLPSMPEIMRQLHTDQLHMQQSVSWFLLGLGVSLLFYGPLSDVYGRKPVVLLGLATAVCASIGCALSHTVMAFLIWRVVQGVGLGVCMGLGRTIIVDVLHERYALVGAYFAMFLGVSPLLAPVLGGYVQVYWGWRANFFLLALLVLCALVAYALCCGETNTHKGKKAFSLLGVWRDYRELLCHRLFIACALLSGMCAAVGVVYATSSAFILQMEFHLSVVHYSWAMMLVGAANILGKFFGPMIIRRYGRDSTLWIGTGMIFVAGALILLAALCHLLGVSWVIGMVIVSVTGQMLIMPMLVGRALTPFHDKRGAAGALFGGAQMVVACVSSVLMALFAQVGVIALGVAYCILALLLSVIIVTIQRQKR